MNKNFFAGLFVGLGLLVIFAFRPAAEKPVAAVQKWEYVIIKSPYGKTHVSEEAMNETGQKGWELVAVEPMYATFKRPME